MDEKKVTMDDIAQRLGISKNSVSVALSGNPGISQTLRQKVIAAAAEMNYSKTKKQNQAQKQNSSFIVILVKEYVFQDRNFYPEVIFSIEQEGKNAGLNTIIKSVTEQEEAMQIVPDIIGRANICGYIMIGKISKAYVLQLLHKKIPMILVDYEIPGVSVDCVVTDNFGGGYEATSYLIKNGHTKIGFCGNPGLHPSFYGRWAGYCKAMLDHGLKLDQAYSKMDWLDHSRHDPDCSPGGSPGTDKGHLFRLIKELAQMPTAFFCQNDTDACTLYRILRELDYSIPHDISLVGFDNDPLHKDIVPNLVTMNINRNLMGKLAVRRLIKHLHNPIDNLFKTALYPDMIKGDTVKKQL